MIFYPDHNFQGKPSHHHNRQSNPLLYHSIFFIWLSSSDYLTYYIKLVRLGRTLLRFYMVATVDRTYSEIILTCGLKISIEIDPTLKTVGFMQKSLPDVAKTLPSIDENVLLLVIAVVCLGAVDSEPLLKTFDISLLIKEVSIYIDLLRSSDLQKLMEVLPATFQNN